MGTSQSSAGPGANVSQALATLRKTGLKFDIMATSFFLGRRSILPSARSG